ncbi:MAG: hypothetical protein IIZ57_10935 [Solobacterium sp.]|nr:hypothetical protein [Solobacterium sp.]
MLNIIVNLLVVILEIRGLYGIIAGHEKGKLLQHGIRALKYFTVLSNLFAMITALINIAFMIVNGPETELPLWLAEVNLMASVGVMLTFMTVMLYLGRLYGYMEMLKGPNFELHLSGPLCMAACFLFFMNLPRMTIRSTLPALLPVTCYGIWYVSNLMINGINPGKHTNDFYGFARAGMKFIPLVYAVMILATWLIAFGLWTLRY